MLLDSSLMIAIKERVSVGERRVTQTICVESIHGSLFHKVEVYFRQYSGFQVLYFCAYLTMPFEIVSMIEDLTTSGRTTAARPDQA